MKVLSDGTDLEGVEKTQDIQYIKLLRKSMWIIASWPRGPRESGIYRYYNCILMFSCLISGFIYLRDNTGKLPSFEIGHTYITVFMNSVSFSRTLCIVSEKYNNIIFYYLDELHLFNHRNKSDYANKTHILIHKICHFFTVYLICMMFNGILLFNLIPLYNSYANGMFGEERPQNATFEHSVYYALPFEYKTDFKGYLVLTIFNWYISVVCSSYFCIVDLTISIMVFHLWGHMRLLAYNLDNFPKPSSMLAESEGRKDDVQNHKYTEQESLEVFSRLREYINHHNLIIAFSSRMSDAFGEVLLVYFLFHQVSGCLLLLECSQMDTKALVRYGPLTVIIFQQLIQISVIFELLGSSNDKLVESVYTLPWEYMDNKNKKLVFIMLTQSQRSINLRAMNMFTVGVQTMITIIKTSFSYFVMLRTVADEE